jgi:hypothetical protein
MHKHYHLKLAVSLISDVVSEGQPCLFFQTILYNTFLFFAILLGYFCL